MGVRAALRRIYERLCGPRYPLTQGLAATLLRGERLVLLDVGAAGGSLHTWDELGDFVVRHGFEPDEAECRRLNDEARATGRPHHYYPVCVAGTTSTARDFFVTVHPQSCSLLPPNPAVIERSRQVIQGRPSPTADWLRLERVVQLPTVSLDEWADRAGLTSVDFIKMDVQGAELEILRGGTRVLQSALGVLAEVWFVPYYVGMPLFADIDVWLRERDFTFFSQHVYSITQFAGRMGAPVAFEGATTFRQQALAGQLVTTDALYLRDLPGAASPQVDVRWLKLACCAELTGQVEFACELVRLVASGFRQRGQAAEAGTLDAVLQSAAQAWSRTPLWARPLHWAREVGLRGPVRAVRAH